MEQEPRSVAEFIAALGELDTALAGARDRLAGARVHDTAFGRLFEAHQVRDAYHARLPEIQLDIDTARAVLGHFVAGLVGGRHPDRTDPDRPDQGGAPVPHQPAADHLIGAGPAAAGDHPTGGNAPTSADPLTAADHPTGGNALTGADPFTAGDHATGGNAPTGAHPLTAADHPAGGNALTGGDA